MRMWPREWLAWHKGVPVFALSANVIDWRSCCSLPGLPLLDSSHRHTLFCHDFMLDGYWFQNTLFLSHKMHPVNAGAPLYYLCSKMVWIFSVLFCWCWSSKFPLKHFLLVMPYTMGEKKEKNTILCWFESDVLFLRYP